jgi:hypothetical protein
MRVLLIDVDSKIANLALMKVSAFHKAQGDDVLLYRHRGRKAVSLDITWDADRTYVSCLFTWNRPVGEALALRFGGLRGGTGFDHGKPASDRAYLPPEIDLAPPDYDLYPGQDYALGFCLRGCNRKCQFCDVPLKEGKIRLQDYRPPWTWVDDRFKKAMLLDNDPALYPDAIHDEIFRWFISAGVKCSITQGYDIRCVTPARAALLADLRPRSTDFSEVCVYTAWDYLGIEGWIRKGIPLLLNAGIKGRNIRCYILCGFNTTHAEDLHRFNVLWKEYGVYPFVMLYNNTRSDPWLRAFARYVNRKIFKSCAWEDYNRRPSDLAE